MFLSAKKSHKTSVASELDHLKQYLPGPFLKAKRPADLNSELEFLNKKFEKRFKTPLKPIQKNDAELTTVKSSKFTLGKQTKIMNSFNIQKAVYSKNERILFS